MQDKVHTFKLDSEFNGRLADGFDMRRLGYTREQPVW